MSENIKKSGASKWVLLVPSLAVALVLIMFIIRTFFLSVVEVNGGSMEPYMKQGEKWLLSRMDKSCDRGDVVIYKYTKKSENLSVSRIIATEGDTVYIDFSSGYVYLNGKKLDEEYISQPVKTGGEYISSLIENGMYGMNEPIVIDKGMVFVMGDNRENSRDSREFGQIPIENIKGTIIKKVK